MTNDRKRKTGGEVELLPLPDDWDCGACWPRAQAYARANVDRALAESRAYAANAAARVLKAELAQRRAEARAERLAGLLREAVGWNWLDDDPPVELGQRIDAALNLEPRND